MSIYDDSITLVDKPRIKKLKFFSKEHLNETFKLDNPFKLLNKSNNKKLTDTKANIENQQKTALKQELQPGRPAVRKISFEGQLADSKALQYGIDSTLLLNDFDVVRKIGSGSFGQVFMIKDKITSKIYAVKILKFKLGKKRTMNEVKILARLNQSTYMPQLLKYYGSFQESNKLYLKMEYCVMNLKQRKRLTNKFKESELRHIIRDLTEILAFLHKNGIVHLDIKPENILIRSCSKRPRFILADYSLALEYKEASFDDIIDGDARYLAPELLNLTHNDDLLHLPKSDIYSLGMTILELILDIDLPSKGPKWHLFRSKSYIRDLLEPLNYSHDLKSFVKRCTSVDPSIRPESSFIKNNFRSPSENERVWLKHLKKYLESKEKELESLLAVETTYTQ